jgi:hypothetical protein
MPVFGSMIQRVGYRNLRHMQDRIPTVKPEKKGPPDQKSGWW